MDRKKDKVYQVLSDFNADSVAKFLSEHDYEMDCLDFKQAWIEKGKLAKILLAMANSGGGIIVFGVQENDDHTTSVCGLESFKDETDIRHSVSKYIPPRLEFSIENYSFDTSEYQVLKGKKVQSLIIKDTPEELPFISTSEGDSLKDNCIYVRNGTACEFADYTSMQKILDRRIKTGHISTLDLDTHLSQLKTLYKYTNDKTPVGLLAGLGHLFTPKAPEEYSNYINDLIDRKKKLIEKDLGIYR